MLSADTSKYTLFHFMYVDSTVMLICYKANDVGL
jgi:hypothetical protein